MHAISIVYQALAVLLVSFPSSAQKFRRPRRIEETMFLDYTLRDTFRSIILSGSELAEDKLTPWSQDQETDRLPQFARSCPSTLFMRYNPNRIPSTTFEARCVQQQCSGVRYSPSLLKRTPKGSIISSPMCRPINYFRWVKVISKKANGRRRINRRLLAIPVGCACSSDTFKQ
ncbi:hypothetical protein PoB_005614900 [Plakobranchus ocellatus]|uniref:Uncharacterized protein n=1 Tax=Plakobranchus ocellatus TaxID=259542 RepID=A0AAV4CAQ3_9GAST|nr:hypothetical protein PoB_005614900 [Plakobranchus ocellatus]